MERIFTAHHGLVFRTAYRITGNAADAEDVLQTVFLRLSGRSASALPVDNPESYLRRAAVNGALDIVRARQSAAGVPLEDLPSSIACPDLRELRAALRQALAKLSPRAAEIFALRFFEGFTNRQIAHTLGISQVLTAVTLHRARRQLQNAMRPYLGGKQ
ncbi:MAG TPA: sigma-70 family RNA polymerase sigma factor [Bryobacteraceae bacterium]|nr:sigma-70 family RNA polymerase sigma factor [Bryobacteraceae bacterium]